MRSPSSIPDSSLVLQAQRGCSKAYSALVRRYYERVLRFCNRRVADPFFAEDLAQDIFLAVYVGLGRLREPERFGSWLFGIASNTVKRFFRESRHVAIAWHGGLSLDAMDEDDCVVTSQSNPEEAVLAQPEYSPYFRFVDSLPHKSRESFKLHYVDDVAYEDMAAILGVPANTVHQRVHYAKTQLKRKLMSPAAPTEVREQVARVLVSSHSDHAWLKETLTTDALDNRIVLALLDPVRTGSASVKVFTYRSISAKNAMVLLQRPSGSTTAAIKSTDEHAVRVFIHLLPSSKPVWLHLTASQMRDIVELYLQVASEWQHSTYCLLPGWINVDVSRHRAVQLDFSEYLRYPSLLESDNELAAMLKTDQNEDLSCRNRYRLYVSSDSLPENPDVYALFVRSNTGDFYELVRHNASDKSDRSSMLQCIASACLDLVDHGFYVVKNIAEQDDIDGLELLQMVGFRPMASSIAASVRRL
jgi:RNA polymerase sigma factor (sigma-70 family)